MPTLVEVIRNMQKEKKEQKILFDETTDALLASLVNYKSNNINSWEQNYGDLLSKYYAWEVRVWSKLSKTERNLLESFRLSLEQNDSDHLYSNINNIIAQSIELVRIIRKKL